MTNLESFRKQAAYFEELAVENGNSGENDWDLVNNRYPQLVDELISALEASMNRERILLESVNIPRSNKTESERYENFKNIDKYDLEEDGEVEPDDENCWVEYPTIEE